MGKLPEQTFVSLHEALTDLAFDDPVTAEHQRSLGLPPDPDLNNLIDQCFVEARSDERYTSFLETFSTRPGGPNRMSKQQICCTDWQCRCSS